MLQPLRDRSFLARKPSRGIAFRTRIAASVQVALLLNLVHFRLVLVFSVERSRPDLCPFLVLEYSYQHLSLVTHISICPIHYLTPCASDPCTATALSIHSSTSTIPFRLSTSNNPKKDIEAGRRADGAEALFDPLQGKQHSSRAHELTSLLYFTSHSPWSFADSTSPQSHPTSTPKDATATITPSEVT